MRRSINLSGKWTMAKIGTGTVWCRGRPDGTPIISAAYSGRPVGAARPNMVAPQTVPSAAMPALSVTDLRKTYDTGVQALKGVSLQVAPGDFFALLGPNGAGKSTLIGIVSSLVNKTSGEVRLFGVDLHAQRDAAMRLIGLVPQGINFNMFEKP